MKRGTGRFGHVVLTRRGLLVPEWAALDLLAAGLAGPALWVEVMRRPTGRGLDSCRLPERMPLRVRVEKARALDRLLRQARGAYEAEHRRLDELAGVVS